MSRPTVGTRLEALCQLDGSSPAGRPAFYKGHPCKWLSGRVAYHDEKDARLFSIDVGDHLHRVGIDDEGITWKRPSGARSDDPEVGSEPGGER